jgi:hypothetical protein
MFMYGVDNENDLFHLILFLNITVTASSKLSCAFFYSIWTMFPYYLQTEKKRKQRLFKVVFLTIELGHFKNATKLSEQI